MATSLEYDPTTRLRNSSQDWNGPMGKKCWRTNEKTKKQVIPLIDTIHNVGTVVSRLSTHPFKYASQLSTHFLAKNLGFKI
jgi:hypothetical protein